MCFGNDFPAYCTQPEFLHLRLREYYPTVQYYTTKRDEDGAMILKKLT